MHISTLNFFTFVQSVLNVDQKASERINSRTVSCCTVTYIIISQQKLQKMYLEFKLSSSEINNEHFCCPHDSLLNIYLNLFLLENILFTAETETCRDFNFQTLIKVPL